MRGGRQVELSGSLSAFRQRDAIGDNKDEGYRCD